MFSSWKKICASCNDSNTECGYDRTVWSKKLMKSIVYLFVFSCSSSLFFQNSISFLQFFLQLLCCTLLKVNLHSKIVRQFYFTSSIRNHMIILLLIKTHKLTTREIRTSFFNRSRSFSSMYVTSSPCAVSCACLRFSSSSSAQTCHQSIATIVQFPFSNKLKLAQIHNSIFANLV